MLNFTIIVNILVVWTNNETTTQQSKLLLIYNYFSTYPSHDRKGYTRIKFSKFCFVVFSINSLVRDSLQVHNSKHAVILSKEGKNDVAA